MKNNAIIRIIIWSFVLVALVCVLAAFVADELYLNDYTPAETAITVPMATHPPEETPLTALANEGELTFPREVNEIEIEWVAGDIIIMARDVDQITISESDVSDEKYSLLWKVRENKLEILFCEERLMPGFGIGNASNLYKDLYIYVPMDWEGSSLEIDAASANVEMHNITLREMDLDGASGTGDFQNCSIHDLDIDTASGDVYFSGILDALDFDAASASFTGDLQNTPSRIDMDGMDGKLDIALPEDCGYTLTMDGISSACRSDFYGTELKNNAHVYGDGRCHINVDGTSCDVTIRKLETIIVPAEETTSFCTDQNCANPDCTDHGHSEAECTDNSCALHHTEENCTDKSCTQHSNSSAGSTHSNHSNDHKSGHH